MKKTEIPMEEALRYLEQMHDNPTLSCQPTGFSQWDELTGGLVRGGLNLIASRPAMGQTALTMELVDHLSKRESGTIMIFSAQESERETFVRLLQIGTGLPASSFMDGSLDREEAAARCKAHFEAQKAKILAYPYTYVDMKMLAYHCSMVPDLRLVVMDDVTRCCKPLDAEEFKPVSLPKRESMERVIGGLKELARSLDVPVVGTVHLPRALERRKDKRPRMKDLDKLQIPTELVDQVAFLYRNNYYYYDSGDNVGECIIAKTRYGTTGTVRLLWDWETGTLKQMQE